MNTIKIEKQQARLVAHRGVSGIEKENTNAAFVAAGNRSYYGIETDIHRTGDGEFVVNHDVTLERVAGEKVNVEEVSLSVLQNIVLFDRDGTKDRADLRPTTLQNYIKICKKYEKQAVLELKSDFTEEETQAIIDIIKSYDYLDNVTFISFCYSNLTKIRKILPTQSVQYLFGEFSERIFDTLVRDHIDVDIYHEILTQEILDRFHAEGLVVNCWTVDKKERAEELAGMGIDYITTNILE